MKIAQFFKNLFGKQPEVPFEYGKFCTLSFAINKYLQGPLRGCLNDQKKIVARIKRYWSQFVFRLFQDAEATWQKFEEEILKAFEAMPEGWLVIHYSGHGTFKRNPKERDGYSEAFYFYNGAYADYQVYELMKKKPEKLNVVFILDCCFSTGITVPRLSGNPTYRHPKFLESDPLPDFFRVTKRALIPTEEDVDWLVFAACGERETASDACINGEFCGAYTFYFEQVMRPGVFFANWQKDVDKSLPSGDFPQTPSLTGTEERIHKMPFELEGKFF